ncbi:MAG: flagellar cap protein FliD N-terminal domain-containing protein, partial [Eubacteriales bacterium]|nr:flagellar cap protein FliD N-terminal domain-containing protein [Eubacteriales bacterium]
MTTINSLSSLSSKTGIGGLVSGMDIDELVLNLTATSRNKIIKQQQKAQKLEWQQTAYRSVTTALKQFQSKYLDVLSQTNFRSASFFNTIKASSSSSATFVSSTPSSVEGTITIDSIEQLATNQTLNSSIAVSKPLSGIISMGNIEELAAELSGKTIGIQLDGKLKTITFDADFTDQVMTDPTEANFCNTLQSAIDKAFGIVNVSDRIIYTQVNA